MPLVKSGSESAFKTNVGTLMKEVGKSKHVQTRDQALAIAYATKRRNRADGGAAPMIPGVSSGPLHAGPVMSSVPGRTDKHNVSVAAGAYVLPADHVSSLGEGNTQAGYEAISQMFGANGPYGVKPLKMKKGPGVPKARPIRAKRAEGGLTEGAAYGEGEQNEVPIIVAGGEYILTPDEVAQVGGGDVAHGHEILDAWVKANRKDHIKTLSKLPGPAKS